MSLKIAVVRASCSTTASSTQNITKAGFGSVKAAIFFVGRDVAGSGSSDELGWSVGFADGTNQGTAAVGCMHGVGTTATACRNDITQCVSIVQGDGTIDGEASFNAFVTDGVQIAWGTNVPATAYRMYVVLIGGSDVDVHVNNFSSPNTIDADEDVTDPGFEPNLILAAAVGQNFSTTASSDPFRSVARSP